MVLESIYGEDVDFPTPQDIVIRLKKVLDAEAAGILKMDKKSLDFDSITQDGIDVTMHFIVAGGNGEDSYPASPPLLKIQSCSLPDGVIRLLTREAVRSLEESHGHPAIYDVVSQVFEKLEGIIKSFSKEASSEYSSVVIAGGESNAKTAKELPERTEKGLKAPRKRSIHDIKSESIRLSEWSEYLDKSKTHEKMRNQRNRLPAKSKQGEVLTQIRENKVTVIMGSTGCGKSTQIPQYILEDAIGRGFGGECFIMCTQPRRISAVGLASRVASERAERVGSTVGYSVRLDSKQSKQTHILFCTTGEMYYTKLRCTSMFSM